MKRRNQTVTPETFARIITLAADDISKLRTPDVMRVIEDFHYTYGNSQAMVDYITHHRPDLASEARECELELVSNPQITESKQ